MKSLKIFAITAIAGFVLLSSGVAHAKVLKVPQVQGMGVCYLASTAMVLKDYNKKIKTRAVVMYSGRIFHKWKRNGETIQEPKWPDDVMVETFENYGYQPYFGFGKKGKDSLQQTFLSTIDKEYRTKFKNEDEAWEYYKDVIKSGNAAIVHVDCSYLKGSCTGSHWIVATGYDEHYFYYNDPLYAGKENRNKKIKKTKFKKAWHKGAANYAPYMILHVEKAQKKNKFRAMRKIVRREAGNMDTKLNNYADYIDQEVTDGDFSSSYIGDIMNFRRTKLANYLRKKKGFDQAADQYDAVADHASMLNQYREDGTQLAKGLREMAEMEEEAYNLWVQKK